MADKTAAPNTAQENATPTGFYFLVGVMAMAFLLIVGYMIYLYLS